jgi:hypothetical protein
MERGEANNIDPLIAQRLEGPHNRSSWPEWINSAFLKDIETVYAAIAHGPKVGGDEINAELGRWVNIISYVLDNSLDGTLNEGTRIDCENENSRLLSAEGADGRRISLCARGQA